MTCKCLFRKSLNETKEMCQAVATATSYYVRNDNHYM